MSLYDPVGSTEVRIIKDLEQRIAALETLVRTVTGAPVTRASSTFFMPNSSPPGPPTGGALAYAVGGAMRVIQANGSIRHMPGLAGTVTTPTVNISNAPASYDQSWNQLHVASTSSINTSLVQLLSVLRTAEVIAP